MKSKLSRKIARSIALLKSHQPNINIVVNEPSNVLYLANSTPLCGVNPEELYSVLIRIPGFVSVYYFGSKPYTFAKFRTSEEAQKALETLQGSKIGNSVIYVAFVDKVPPIEIPSPKPPDGLSLLEEFLTPEEEESFAIFIQKILENQETSATTETALKHRKVLHFGYTFDYSTNKVLRDGSLTPEIPAIFSCLPTRLSEITGDQSDIPNQLTINIYQPGQGIPPHTETHSCFKENLFSISLLSGVVMELRDPESFDKPYPLLLPPRSCLWLRAESRYKWKHGINPRKFDFIPSNGQFFERKLRISLTFRTVTKKDCSCDFPKHCDSPSNKYRYRNSDKSIVTLPTNDFDAQKLERDYVKGVYEKIAPHFSETRHSRWSGVKKFLDSIPKNSILLDIGCGNGKYLGGSRSDHPLFTLGLDNSLGLLEICLARGFSIIAGDALNIPLRDSCSDFLLSIAVIHHFSTQARRLQALRELIRVLSPGGQALITVWALEQKGSIYTQWGESKNRVDQGNNEKNISSGNGLSIHSNNRNFKQQDLLVPWTIVNKGKKVEIEIMGDDQKKYLRFYHVFKEGELESLVAQVENCRLKICDFEQGNWCAILEKL